MSPNIFATELFENIGKFIFLNKNIRNWTLISNIISIILGIFLFFYLTIYGTKEELDYFYKYTSGIFLMLPSLTFISFLFFIISVRKTPLENQLEHIFEERRKLTEKIETEAVHDIFNTIQLSLNQLNEYYTINKSQAKSSFNFSLFSIVIGLLTILLGIWLYYFEVKNIQVTYIATISGLILEFIGGAYFFMYKKSLEQVNFFFGQLIKIQDTMLAINLAKESKSANKGELEEKIIISLLERSLK